MSRTGQNLRKEREHMSERIGVMTVGLAGLRVLYEEIRASRAARTVCRFLLAALVLTLWTLITFRVAQAQAQESFEAWKTRFAEDYIAQQEAKAIGIPPDPRELLREQEATAFAKLMSGLKLYGYSADDFRTLAQGVACRVANPAYPNSIVEVIEQPKQWPGYDDTNEVTQKNFDLAMKILAELDAQEHPPISSDYVYASFERDGISLRDTWDIGTRTHFWRSVE
jgi:hypothetical protein